MESCRLMACRAPKLRLDAVEDGVAHLVTKNVRARSGEDGLADARPMKEIQRLPIIERVQVGTLVQQNFERRTDLPIATRYPGGPKVGAAAQRFSRVPVAECHRVGLKYAGGRRRRRECISEASPRAEVGRGPYGQLA